MITHAAVCRIGHVVSDDIAASPAPVRCRLCGTRVWTVCPSCEAPLPGLPFTMIQGSAGTLVRRLLQTQVQATEDCPACQEPYPWSFPDRKPA